MASVRDVRSVRTASPWEQLRHHARERGDGVALVRAWGDSFEIRTWLEVTQGVEYVAAALLAMGLRPRQAVVISMASGPDLNELDLAVRAVGAVPVYLDPTLRARDVVDLLAATDVALIVSDGQRSRGRLRPTDLPGVATLTLATDDDWIRLRERGAAAIVRDPSVLTAAGVADRPWTASVVLTRHDGDAVAVRRLPVSAPAGDPGPVLLYGAVGDPHVAFQRAEHLATGGSLAWTSDGADLPLLFQTLAPTSLVLDGPASADLDRLLSSATVGGKAWHRTPAEVLAAVAAVPSPGADRGLRRRVASLEKLRPWFGGRLHYISTTTEPTSVLAGVAAALEFDLGVLEQAPWEPAALPRPPKAGSRTSSTLPRRARGALDGAFTPMGSRSVRVRQRTSTSPPAAPVSASPPHDSGAWPDPGLVQQDGQGSALLDPPTPPLERIFPMSNVDVILKEAMAIDGAQAALLVDYQSGMSLGQAGDATALNLDVAAAGNTDVVRAKMRTMESLGLDDTIEDILITLGKAYHLIRLTQGQEGLFLYLVLDKSKANLAMARHKLGAIEKSLVV